MRRAPDVQDPCRRLRQVPGQEVDRARALQQPHAAGQTRRLDAGLVVGKDLALHGRRGYPARPLAVN